MASRLLTEISNFLEKTSGARMRAMLSCDGLPSCTMGGGGGGQTIPMY